MLSCPLIDFRDPDDRDRDTDRQRCIVAQCGARLSGTLVAFPIDSEIALHRPGAADRQVSDVPRPPFADGMFGVGGELVALLNLDALLTTCADPSAMAAEATAAGDGLAATW